MSNSGYQDLILDLPCPIESLEALSITIKPNHHGQATLKAILSAGEQFNPVERPLIGAVMRIMDPTQSTTRNPKGILFAGLIQQFTISQTKGYSILEAQALTGTVRLDLKAKSRSFQDTGQTYREILEAILADTSGAAVICTHGINETIPYPLIQYQETDWAFCQHLASHLGALLLPETTEEKPRFWFGMRNGSKMAQTFTEECYQVKKDYGQYLKLGGGEDPILRERDNFTYQLTYPGNLILGDTTIFRNKILTLCAKTIVLEKGQLVYTYTLGYPKGYSQKTYANPKLQGASILGRILDREGEKLKLHLEIDQAQEKSKAHWYTYTPLTGNQLYTLPEIGEKVYLQIKNGDQGTITGLKRTNSESCNQTGRPDHKYLNTERNKEIALLPETLTLKDGTNTLTLTDQAGVNLSTAQAISLKAQGQVRIKAAGVAIKGQSKIKLTQKQDDGSFLIKNEFNTLGAKGLIQTMASHPIAPPEKQPSLKIDPYHAVMSALAGIAR